MTLRDILIFVGFAALWRFVLPMRARKPLLLAGSVLAIFWLQPSTPIRNLDFWMPVATLTLAVFGWALTTPPAGRRWRQNLPALALTAALVLAVALTRFLSPTGGVITASRPPQIEQVLLVLLALGLLLLGAARLAKGGGFNLWGFFLLLLALFVVIKLPELAQWAAGGLRQVMGQPAALATPLDLRWLGFSYVAFRLIHTVRDRQAGRLPTVALDEYLIYVIFFPAFTAGPIDRVDRFIKDLRAITPSKALPKGEEPSPAATSPAPAGGRRGEGLSKPDWQDDLVQAGYRLALGLFRKFVVSSLLALIALSPANAAQTQSPGWLWVMLIAYAWQIYFDFAGYTDIAIGIARLMGIKLPENFNAPYAKPNLTQFWNNWHMTLTQWFRAYYFNPLTRWFRTSAKGVPAWLVLLFCQLTTMLLIGLWHGMTWNFVLWGAWHGVGLFVQNRYSEWLKPRAAGVEEKPRLKSALAFGGSLANFVFVALGWVWFALPDPATAISVFQRLFGL